jgi:hypothetical protein|tara:strand:+ start:654 stop:815 length:162 start_codon:yes stop_codon:yes gene_type:complete
MNMEITIKFSGEMKMDVDIEELMDGQTSLRAMVEEYITSNMYELMECNVTVEE